MRCVASPFATSKVGHVFAGLRRKHTFAEMSKDIPRSWDDFNKLGVLSPGRSARRRAGAIWRR